MASLDWLIVGAFAGWLALDGWRHARRARDDAQHWLLAGRNAPWWAMGLSVMATQASAITLIGTTGKGFEDGTRFAQFYYSLPIAMLLLSLFFLPFYAKERSVTAYDWLERRFGRGPRTAVAGVFLVQRALSLGVVLSVPSLLLSVVFGAPYWTMVLAMAIGAVLYTTAGGVAAVLSTDVKQMAVMLLGLVGLFVCALAATPDGIGFRESWVIADALGQIELWDSTFDTSQRYNIWSSLFGALIIFMAYFGTDQSQVQRYLAGRDLGHQRRALMLNAVAKVPLQIGILLLGVLFFQWSLTEPTPLFMSPAKAEETAQALPDYPALEAEHEAKRRAVGDQIRAFGQASPAERAGVIEDLKARHAELIDFRAGVEDRRQEAQLDAQPETNYIVPWFLTQRIPIGLVGLFFAAIFAAALSSIDSELTALGAVATIDLLRMDPEDPAQARRLLRTSRLMTALAGILAATFAFTLAHAESVVEKVNAVGSLFYGSLLGVFLMAMLDRGARGRGLITGLVAGMGAVPLASYLYRDAMMGADLPFVWQNTVGLLACLTCGTIASRMRRE